MVIVKSPSGDALSLLYYPLKNATIFFDHLERKIIP